MKKVFIIGTVKETLFLPSKIIADKYNTAEKRLREAGYCPINPFTPESLNREIDYGLLERSEAVYVLTQHRHYTDARKVFMMALDLKKPIVSKLNLIHHKDRAEVEREAVINH
jgi:hypothetical protein